MEKELIILMMAKDMKVNLKMVKQKEEEFFITKMIDMKEIGKIIIWKETEFIIIIMVIEKWVIIQMVKKLENMSNLLKMEGEVEVNNY